MILYYIILYYTYIYIYVLLLLLLPLLITLALRNLCIFPSYNPCQLTCSFSSPLREGFCFPLLRRRLILSSDLGVR